MIEISITQTAKSNPRDDYGAYNDERHIVKDMAEAKAWLKERYGNCKRSYIYQDTKSGETKRVGYIYHFRNSDISHNSKSWYQQDWVTFLKNTPVTV